MLLQLARSFLFQNRGIFAALPYKLIAPRGWLIPPFGFPDRPAAYAGYGAKQSSEPL
jgi:hypothetical protein